MWMESWLTTWPFAFPVTYLAVPLLLRLTAPVSASVKKPASRAKGIAFNDIAGVSERVTSAHGFTVLRKLKASKDFRA
jgi:hypothetical protein